MENRILVFDDDPAVLEALDISLTYYGFQVRSMRSDDNFFQMIDDFEPDLVIVDYLLNGRNGGEVCHDLKSDPEKKDIPVILLSAYPEAETNSEYGFDSFLAKPFDLNLLVNEIRAFINPTSLVIR
jgi:DNA-binding response OmpR family regulator